MPPAFCASAMICSVMVVLPDDSGPKISMTRPRGTPPTPSAASKEMEPVEMAAMGTTSLLPRRMMEPLPNCFSICESAKSIARERSSATWFSSLGTYFQTPGRCFKLGRSGFECMLAPKLPGRRKTKNYSNVDNGTSPVIRNSSGVGCAEVGTEFSIAFKYIRHPGQELLCYSRRINPPIVFMGRKSEFGAPSSGKKLKC